MKKVFKTSTDFFSISRPQFPTVGSVMEYLISWWSKELDFKKETKVKDTDIKQSKVQESVCLSQLKIHVNQMNLNR